MNKSIRYFLLLIVVVMLSVSFLGCASTGQSKEADKTAVPSNTDNQGNDNEDKNSQSEPVELTICMNDNFLAGAQNGALLEASKKYIEEKNNVKLNIELIPKDQYKDKINRMVASGQTPDIFITQQSMKYLPLFAVKGEIIPLDEYISSSSILSKVDPSLFDFLKINGKTYFLPVTKLKAKNLFLRKDLMDKYGIKLSSTPTTEEFYNEFKKAVGKGVVPLTFPKFIDNLQFFFSAFGVYADIYPENGKYVDGFNTEEAKEALAYMAQLYREGILDKNFTSNENAAMRDNLYKGLTIGIIDYYSNYTTCVTQSKKADMPTDYFPIYTLVGPNGESGNLNEAVQDAFVVSKNCKNPEAAVKLIEWMNFTDEGRIVCNLGVKGTHYTVENGEIKLLDAAKEAKISLGSAASLLSQSVFQIQDYGFKWDADTEGAKPSQSQITNEVMKYLGPTYAAPTEKSEKYENISLMLKEQRETIIRKIVVGELTVEQGYDEYNKYWERINGDDILAELNQ